MDSTALLEESKMEVLNPKQLPSLYQICQHLTDGRKARGRRYDLAGILLVVVWAKLAGMSSVLAVSEWARVSGGNNSLKRGPGMETHAVRQYVQLRPGTLRESTGQCASGRLVCAPDAPAARRRARGPACPPGY
jgi:hypothetical protein